MYGCVLVSLSGPVSRELNTHLQAFEASQNWVSVYSPLELIIFSQLRFLRFLLIKVLLSKL